MDARTETNGILDAREELGIGLVAYSPLSKGFLTGAIGSDTKIAEGDYRRSFPADAHPRAFRLKLNQLVRVRKCKKSIRARRPAIQVQVAADIGRIEHGAIEEAVRPQRQAAAIRPHGQRAADRSITGLRL